MSTKGPSNRFGNTNGSNRRGTASSHIGYPWAKDFGRGGIDRHFSEHGKEFGASSKEQYAAMAVHFANEINRSDYKSVIDYKRTTYKYDPNTSRLVLVTKDGFVVSFYHTGKGFYYSPRKGVVIWKKIK